jgi:glycosyltransferase involved in cell wall biosynthesis
MPSHLHTDFSWVPFAEGDGGAEVFVDDFLQYANSRWPGDITAHCCYRSRQEEREIVEGRLHLNRIAPLRPSFGLPTNFAFPIYQAREMHRVPPASTVFVHRLEHVLPYLGRKDCKVVLYVHDGGGHYNTPHESLWRYCPLVYRGLERIAVGRADRVLCASERCARYFAEAHPAAARRIFVLDSYFSDDRFYPVDQVSARLQLGLEPDNFLAMYVGRFERVKNLPLLVDVMERMSRMQPNLHLAFLGDGREREWLARELAERGLEGRVVRFGRVSHSSLREWYAAANVCLLLSHSEGCPRATLESAACGTPTVTTPVGDMRVHSRTWPDLFRVCQPDAEAIAGAALEFGQRRATIPDSFRERFCGATALRRVMEYLQ